MSLVLKTLIFMQFPLPLSLIKLVLNKIKIGENYIFYTLLNLAQANSNICSNVFAKNSVLIQTPTS